MQGTILIVGVPEEIEQTYLPYLPQERYQITICQGVAQTSSAIQQLVPHVVIIDSEAEPSVKSICDCIRCLPGTQAMPVLLGLSPQLLDRIASDLPSCVDDYLLKPFEQGKLLARLTPWLTLGQSPGLPQFTPSPHGTLDYYRQLAKHHYQHGNLGLGLDIMHKIQEVLSLFPDKRDQISQINAITHTLSNIIKQQVPEISQAIDRINLTCQRPGSRALEGAPAPSDASGALAQESLAASPLPGKAPQSDQPDQQPLPTKYQGASGAAVAPSAASTEVVEEVDVFFDSEDGLEAISNVESEVVLLQTADSEVPQEQLLTAPPVASASSSVASSQGEPLSSAGAKCSAVPQEQSSAGAKCSAVPQEQLEEAAFVEALLTKGVLSKQQLRQALMEQEDLKNAGQQIRFCDLILSRKLVTLETLLRTFGRGILSTYACPNCQLKFKVVNPTHEPAHLFQCDKCGQPLKPLDASQQSDQVEDVHIKPTAENIPLLMDQALKLAENKEYRKAVAIYTQIIKIDGDYYNAYEGRAKLYMELHEYERAVNDANRVLLHVPSHHEMICVRGIAEYYCRRMNEAINDMSVLIRNQLHLFPAYSTRGKAYLHQKNYAAAVADLSAALKLQPRFIKGYAYRGQALYALGEYAQAIADFKQVLQLNPTYPHAENLKKMISMAQARLGS